MTKINNLDALADQIYQEGIEKAKKESEALLEEARLKARAMIEEAEEKAESIISEAKSKSSHLEMSTRNEIQVKSRQAISDLKVSIQELLLTASLEQPVSKAFRKEEFLKELMLTVSRQWDSSDELNILVPPELQDQIRSYVAEVSGNKLPSLEVKPSPAMKNGFRIEDRKNGYYISFSDEDFAEFLKPYFSERLRQLLFN